MSLFNTLLEFFGESNWAYVLDHQSHGIIDAEVTTDPNDPVVHVHSLVIARIVLRTESGNTWSVIRTPHTLPGLWEAALISELDNKILRDPVIYKLPSLLSIVNHTSTPWKPSPKSRSSSP